MFTYFFVSNYLFLRGFVIAFLENTAAYMHDDACMTYDLWHVVVRGTGNPHLLNPVPP